MITSRNILWGNKDCDFYFLPILKNAHTWGEIFFKQNFNFNWLGNEAINLNYNEKKVIVFLREPLSRWFSGAAQWFWQRKNYGKEIDESFVLDELVLDLIFSAGKLDDHTKTQCEAFGNIGHNSCWLFDTEDINFNNNLIHFFKNVKGVNLLHKNLSKVNTIEMSLPKVSIRKQLELAYNANPLYKESLQRYLYHDLIMFSNLKESNKFYTINEK